jgi:Zn finger protein HypA/HybF involved in hydrogenase expression
MNYDQLYIIALVVILFLIYKQWIKNKNIEYKDIEILCENCKEEIKEVYEEDEKYIYTCKKCKTKGSTDIIW